MRKIIFRGKRKDNGEWVYGWYVNKAEAKHQIVTKEDVMPISVHPETVGQFTGLTDKNGKEIYEGDKVKVSVKNKGLPIDIFGKISWSDGDLCYMILWLDGDSEPLYGWHNKELEVIGNIHNI